MAKPAIRVEVHGVPEFIDGCDTLVERIGATSAERLGKVADQAGGDVRRVVPHHTGKLTSSVKSGLSKNQKKASVRIGARVPYAGWVEFGGTRGRPYVKAGRYLYPTALGAEPQVILAARKAADDEIRSMHWKKP